MTIYVQYRNQWRKSSDICAIQKSMEEVKCYAIVNIMTLILEDMDSCVLLDNRQL